MENIYITAIEIFFSTNALFNKIRMLLNSTEGSLPFQFIVKISAKWEMEQTYKMLENYCK